MPQVDVPFGQSGDVRLVAVHFRLVPASSREATDGGAYFSGPKEQIAIGNPHLDPMDAVAHRPAMYSFVCRTT